MRDTISERRANVRVPLDTLRFVTVRNEQTAQEFSVLLVDCGCGGMQLNFPPDEGIAKDWLGASVLLLDLPEILDPSGQGVRGAVCWLSDMYCGIRFFKSLELSEPQLLEL